MARKTGNVLKQRVPCAPGLELEHVGNDVWICRLKDHLTKDEAYWLLRNRPMIDEKELKKRLRRKASLSGRFQQMTLLEVLDELTGLYPTLLLVDMTRPDEGPFPVKDIRDGVRFMLEREEVPIELRSFLQIPHWIWGMEGLGFVSVWAMPEDQPMILAFKEHEGGLPIGRPPFVK